MNDTIDIYKFAERTLDTSFKGGMVMTLENDFKYKNDTQRFRLLDEIVVHVPIVMYFQKNSFLAEPFNDKLRALTGGGFIKYWNDLESENLRREEERHEPKKLTVKNLLGAFQFVLWGWLISTLAFLLEISKYLRDRWICRCLSIQEAN